METSSPPSRRLRDYSNLPFEIFIGRVHYRPFSRAFVFLSGGARAGAAVSELARRRRDVGGEETVLSIFRVPMGRLPKAFHRPSKGMLMR